MTDYDYLLIGGGLANGLVVLALSRHQPGARVALIEASDRLGGNHTWSFHAADVPADAVDLVEPLVVVSWPCCETRFGEDHRMMASRYATVTSERFDAVAKEAIAARGWDLRLGSRAIDVGEGYATLASGERLTGRCVIDARGPTQRDEGCGYQKFFGIEIEADEPWPDRFPVVMDASVPQTDGFHFIYTLPMTPQRVLVEDTYFSDTPELDAATARRQAEAYIGERVHGWRVIREESGVLPMPWCSTRTRLGNGPLLGGYAGGWFHPATGYSFPVALRFASAVASATPDHAIEAAAALARRLRFRGMFARFLNFLLFRLVPPKARGQVFARLYRTLPPSVMARFYAMEFTVGDAFRILIGRPPRIDPLRLLRLPGRSLWSSLQR